MGIFSKKPKAVFLNMNGRLVPVQNRSEAQMYAEQFLKICKESTNLVNITKSPRVFFERYDLLVDCTINLQQLETILNFKGQKPSTQLEILKREKENETNLMIGRFVEVTQAKIDSLKTTSAKIKKIQSAFAELSTYDDKMTLKNIELYRDYYNTIISNYQ